MSVSAGPFRWLGTARANDRAQFVGRLSPLAWTYSPIPTALVRVSKESIVVRAIWRRSIGELVVPVAERERIRLSNDRWRVGALLEIAVEAYTPLQQVELWGSARFQTALRRFGWIDDMSADEVAGER